MRFLISISLYVLCLGMNAQSFQGKAIYLFNNSYAQVDWGKKKMSDAEVSMWKSKLSEGSRKTYQLNFTLQESSWAKVESLAVGGGGKGGDKAGWDDSQENLLYKNLANQSYKVETEAFDKLFLVNGDLELPAWEITGETKTIGDYQVQKAIYTREKQTMAFGKEEPVMEKEIVEAWFTTQIPISSGPDYYWGLPGLILEIKNGNISYTCERVELNSSGDFSIEIPKKGQKVTAEELDKIVEEKTEEMYKRFNKSGKKG